MREPLDINQATLRGILILTIITVLAASWFIWWGQHLEPLPQKPVVSPQTTGEAKIQASVLEPTLDTLLAWNDAPQAPHCAYSIYRDGGAGITVKWAITDGGLTAPWTRVDSKWSCRKD